MFSYRRSWVNPLGGELLVNGQIGRQSKLGAEFYQPLANDSPLFVAPYAALGKSVRPIYAGDQHLADLVTRDARLGVDLGAALGHWGELRIGALLRQSNAITETGPEALPDIRTTDNGLRLRIFGDQLDAPWFPRSGHRVMLEAYEAVPALGNGPRYHRVDLSLTRAYTLGDQSIEATLGAATSFGSRLPSYAAITLGGPFQLSGYATEQLSGQESLFARLRLMHRFLQLPGPLGQGLYGGLSLEAGRIGRSYRLLGSRDSTALPDTLWSGAAFIGADTFLGPAWLGLGYGGAGHVSLFLSLGVP
jgi:NTE family protein